MVNMFQLFSDSIFEFNNVICNNLFFRNLKSDNRIFQPVFIIITFDGYSDIIQTNAVTLVRKYFRLHAHEPPDRIYAELLGYTRPVVSGRADKRNIKPKSAVWFVYRVA